MVRVIEATVGRFTRLFAPRAEAEAAACYSQYSHCGGGCPLWVNQIYYDRICNWQYQYTYGAGCGTCAA